MKGEAFNQHTVVPVTVPATPTAPGVALVWPQMCPA